MKESRSVFVLFIDLCLREVAFPFVAHLVGALRWAKEPACDAGPLLSCGPVRACKICTANAPQMETRIAIAVLQWQWQMQCDLCSGNCLRAATW